MIRSSPLEITLDPTAIEDRLPSAAFDVTAEWKMPYQQARIIIKECWLEYKELNRFEADFSNLIDGRIEKVKLSDMSSDQIMLFKKNDDQYDFEFIAKDTANMGTILIKSRLYGQELIEIARNMKDWAKWW